MGGGTTTPTTNYDYSLLNASGGPSNYASNYMNTTYLPANYGSGATVPSSFTYTPTPVNYNAFTPSYTSTPTTSTSSFNLLNPSGGPSSYVSNYLNPLSTATPQIKATSGSGSFLSGLGKNLAGGIDLSSLTKMGLGFLIPQPKSTIPSGQELLAKYQGVSTSPEGAAAKAKMGEYITNPENIGGQATTNYVNALNADFDAQDVAELAQFKSDWIARGYNTTGSDYNKAMNDLTAKQAIRRNTATSGARVNLLNTQIQAQLQMIAAAYGVDQQLLQELMTLDVEIAAQKYGLAVETINQFRKAIYDMALTGEYNKQQGTTTGAIQQLTAAIQGGK
jgi:hypothetical protein